MNSLSASRTFQRSALQPSDESVTGHFRFATRVFEASRKSDRSDPLSLPVSCVLILDSSGCSLEMRAWGFVRNIQRRLSGLHYKNACNSYGFPVAIICHYTHTDSNKLLRTKMYRLSNHQYAHGLRYALLDSSVVNLILKPLRLNYLHRYTTPRTILR